MELSRACLKRGFRLLVLVVVVALATGCGLGPEPRQPDPRARLGMSLPELIDRVDERAPGQQQPAVLERLPEPDKVTLDYRQNRYDPAQTDTVYTLFYPGLQLQVYQVADSGKRIVSQIVVTDPAYQTAQGLRVGSSLQALSDALGEADRLEGDEYVYLVNGPTEDTLRVQVREEQVARLVWDFYLE